MSKIRDKCEYKKRCGATGHFLENGQWTRCPCLILEMNKSKLAEMFCDNPRQDTPLKKKLETNLRIEGPLTTVRPHVSGALLSLQAQRETFMIMDAYRLIEIFLEKDDEFENSRPALDAGLLVILLGFGDPRNRYLPELLVQTLNRRELVQKPTWVVMGLDMGHVAHKYSSDLHDMLARFEKVTTK